MTKKTVGYVNLEWTCPNCGSRNPGVNKKCATCGLAQPENVQFEQSAQDTLITDTAKIEAAKSGPDIHCPYCGTRTPRLRAVQAVRGRSDRREGPRERACGRRHAQGAGSAGQVSVLRH